MEQVKIRSTRTTVVHVLDEPGAGGACHHYTISKTVGMTEEHADIVCQIFFHEGPLEEVNGCFTEDLLAIVLHHLRGFQSGELRCRENAIAVTKIEEAMHRLGDRTKDREERGVLGTSAL